MTDPLKEPPEFAAARRAGAQIATADDVAEDAARRTRTRLTGDDDEWDDDDDDSTVTLRFRSPNLVHDGGHDAYTMSVPIHQIHSLVRSGAIKIDTEHQRGKDSVTQKQIVRQKRIDEWRDELLSPTKPFMGQMTWNVRPEENGTVKIERDDRGRRILAVRGQIWMPDAYHRMMAAVAAHEVSHNSGGGIPPGYRCNVIVHNLSALWPDESTPSEEDRLFANMNPSTRTAADQTRVTYLAPKGAGLVAHQFVKNSPHLGPAGNVEQSRNTLSIKNARLMTYNTVAKAIDGMWPGAAGASVPVQAQIAAFMVTFWNALVLVRPELGVQALSDRQRIRRESIVDSAGMINAYVRIAYLLYSKPDTPERFACLDALAATNTFTYQPAGAPAPLTLDWFDRRNPAFRSIGLMVPMPTKTDPDQWGLRNAKDAFDALRRLVLHRVGLVTTPDATAATAAAAGTPTAPNGGNGTDTDTTPADTASGNALAL